MLSKIMQWRNQHLAQAQPEEEQQQDDPEGKSRLEQLSRAPAQCPIGRCQHFIFPSGLLSHLRHLHDECLVFRDAYESEPLRLRIPDVRGIEGCDTPHCVSVLQFGGECIKKRIRTPGGRYLCVPNSGLSRADRKYENYLPMLLMVAKSSWYAMLPSGKGHSRKDKERELLKKTGGKRKNDDCFGIYVLWLTAPITVKPFYYTLTVFNDSYDHSVSVLRKSRNISHSQRPSDFLAKETDYMILRDSEIQVLVPNKVQQGSQQEPGYMQIEIIIHELMNGSLTKQPSATSTADKRNPEPQTIPIIYARKADDNNNKNNQSDDDEEWTSSETVTNSRCERQSKVEQAPRATKTPGKIMYISAELSGTGTKAIVTNQNLTGTEATVPKTEAKPKEKTPTTAPKTEPKTSEKTATESKNQNYAATEVSLRTGTRLEAGLSTATGTNGIGTTFATGMTFATRMTSPTEANIGSGTKTKTANESRASTEAKVVTQLKPTERKIPTAALVGSEIKPKTTTQPKIATEMNTANASKVPTARKTETKAGTEAPSGSKAATDSNDITKAKAVTQLKPTERKIPTAAFIGNGTKPKTTYYPKATFVSKAVTGLKTKARTEAPSGSKDATEAKVVTQLKPTEGKIPTESKIPTAAKIPTEKKIPTAAKIPTEAKISTLAKTPTEKIPTEEKIPTGAKFLPGLKIPTAVNNPTPAKIPTKAVSGSDAQLITTGTQTELNTEIETQIAAETLSKSGTASAAGPKTEKTDMAANVDALLDRLGYLSESASGSSDTFSGVEHQLPYPN